MTNPSNHNYVESNVTPSLKKRQLREESIKFYVLVLKASKSGLLFKSIGLRLTSVVPEIHSNKSSFFEMINFQSSDLHFYRPLNFYHTFSKYHVKLGFFVGKVRDLG